MILPKISLPRCQAFIKFPLNNTFNFRPDRVQQRQLQIANPNEEFMSGTKKAVHSYTPWYVERKVNLFGRNSASGTGESFYRMQPNLEYDPSLKAGLFLQMFRGFCSSSLRAHRFNVASHLLREAVKHLKAQINCDGGNFMDMQMREAVKMHRKN